MAAQIIDLTGNRYGNLFVKKMLTRKVSPEGKLMPIQYLCECDCGNTCVVSANFLRTGNKTSCGCARKKGGIAAPTIRSVVQQMRKKNFGSIECPYPSPSCLMSKAGLCCYDCEKKAKCKFACLNRPEKCGGKIIYD